MLKSNLSNDRGEKQKINPRCQSFYTSLMPSSLELHPRDRAYRRVWLPPDAHWKRKRLVQPCNNPYCGAPAFMSCRHCRRSPSASPSQDKVLSEDAGNLAPIISIQRRFNHLTFMSQRKKNKKTGSEHIVSSACIMHYLHRTYYLEKCTSPSGNAYV